MEKYTTSLLLLAVIGCLLQEVTGQQCSTIGVNGIIGCQCNFMEACDAQGNPKNNWAQYLPTDVNQYGLVVGRQRNLAYLCEVGAVAILYDCNNRIPLYAATIINGSQLSGRSFWGRPSKTFRRSHLNWLHPHFQNKKMETTYVLQSENFAIQHRHRTGTSLTMTGYLQKLEAESVSGIHVHKDPGGSKQLYTGGT